MTRGAIYWHFANKTALFDAMREQVSVPLIDRTDYALLADARRRTRWPRWSASCAICWTASRTTATRAQTFQIMMLKCEYVDEFEPELARQADALARAGRRSSRKVYARARRAGTLRAGLTPAMAALDTCVFVSGPDAAMAARRARRADTHACAAPHRRARRRSSQGRDTSVSARAAQAAGGGKL